MEAKGGLVAGRHFVIHDDLNGVVVVFVVDAKVGVVDLVASLIHVAGYRPRKRGHTGVPRLGDLVAVAVKAGPHHKVAGFWGGPSGFVAC